MIHALCMCGLHKVEKVITVMSNPRQYKIPDWFLNRQKDVKDGKYSQALSNVLDSKIREDLERLKKIRAHRGLRHYWGSVHGVCRVLLSSRGADCKVLWWVYLKKPHDRTLPNFCTCGRCSVLLWWHYNTLCTSFLVAPLARCKGRDLSSHVSVHPWQKMSEAQSTPPPQIHP